MKISTNQNTKTEFTRMCIGEAIIALLEETELSRLKVSDIVKKAGVARMSFYRYYANPTEALKDYMEIIISGYVEAIRNEANGDRYMEPGHLQYALEYYDRYADFFLTLKHHGLYGIMMEEVNRFMEEHVMLQRKLSVYELYSYAGGLLNTFLQWEENGKKDSAADVAAVISRRYLGEKKS